MNRIWEIQRSKLVASVKLWLYIICYRNCICYEDRKGLFFVFFLTISWVKILEIFSSVETSLKNLYNFRKLIQCSYSSHMCPVSPECPALWVSPEYRQTHPHHWNPYQLLKKGITILIKTWKPIRVSLKKLDQALVKRNLEQFRAECKVLEVPFKNFPALL